MILEVSPNNSWPIEHFIPQEVKDESQLNTFVKTSDLIQTLQNWDIIRNYVNKSVIITDACRFNGSPTSQHYFKRFNAIDGWVNGYTSEELMEIVEGKNLGLGRGLYPENNGFIHLDNGREPKPYRNGSVIRWYRDKFGKYHTVSNFKGLI